MLAWFVRFGKSYPLKDTLGPRIRDEVKRGGVEPLKGGLAGELELLKTDGGNSLYLAVSNPAGKLDIPVIGSKHAARFGRNYVIHTYLMFKADKPRPAIGNQAVKTKLLEVATLSGARGKLELQQKATQAAENIE